MCVSETSLEVRDEDGMMKIMCTPYRDAARAVRRAEEKSDGGADNSAEVRLVRKRLMSARQDFLKSLEDDSVGLDLRVCMCMPIDINTADPGCEDSSV